MGQVNVNPGGTSSSGMGSGMIIGIVLVVVVLAIVLFVYPGIYRSSPNAPTSSAGPVASGAPAVSPTR